MKRRGHLIKTVEPGSIAQELELEAGDYVLSIDGEEIEDRFDYDYKLNNDKILMLVEKKNGESWELEIENQYEDLGIVFENGLMSDYRSCKNKCIFCFIDQMPQGMRDTLYFKDDDSRLSFLQGNYITLTNMTEHDIDRIIQFKLSPINISVHTTNPKLRCQMLNNRFAGQALSKLRRLYEAGTPMNGQIVLCKGINDGQELDRSIRDLSAYLPYMESLSVVPVGLTKYRDGLHPLKAFTKEDAGQVLEIVERWQKRLFLEHQSHFIHASDEFYILAGRDFPEEDRYDGYLQLENGVGMMRLLFDEVEAALRDNHGDVGTETVTIATGVLASPYIRRLADKVEAAYPQRKVEVCTVENRFFGEQITVAGLVTGKDLLEQLRGRKLGARLLLPSVMFRSGEEVFLDDMTREQLQNALQVPVNIVKSSGHDFVGTILHPSYAGAEDYEGYELKELDYE